MNIYVFVKKLNKLAKHVAEEYRPDLVIASSCYPFDIYPCKKIARTAGSKLCFEVHDLWPLTPMLVGGYSKWHPYIMMMQRAENVAYKSADFVNSLLWNSEKHGQEHGLLPGKFQCVPNGYFKEDWTDVDANRIPKDHLSLFRRLREEDKLVVGFAGSFAPAQYLETVLGAAKILLSNEKIHFVIVGRGPKYDDYMTIVKKDALSNVTILPAVSKDDVPNIVANFDVCYMGGGHSNLHQYGTSFNKEIDYYLAGKPVIKSIDEPGSLLERLNCGIQTEAENPQQVADAIIKLASMSEEERIDMGARGKKYAESNLEWSVLAKKFLAPMDKLK